MWNALLFSLVMFVYFKNTNSSLAGNETTTTDPKMDRCVYVCVCALIGEEKPELSDNI